jgi:hypothetical protein
VGARLGARAAHALAILTLATPFALAQESRPSFDVASASGRFVVTATRRNSDGQSDFSTRDRTTNEQTNITIPVHSVTFGVADDGTIVGCGEASNPHQICAFVSRAGKGFSLRKLAEIQHSLGPCASQYPDLFGSLWLPNSERLLVRIGGIEESWYPVDKGLNAGKPIKIESPDNSLVVDKALLVERVYSTFLPRLGDCLVVLLTTSIFNKSPTSEVRLYRDTGQLLHSISCDYAFDVSLLETGGATRVWTLDSARRPVQSFAIECLSPSSAQFRELTGAALGAIPPRGAAPRIARFEKVCDLPSDLKRRDLRTGFAAPGMGVALFYRFPRALLQYQDGALTRKDTPEESFPFTPHYSSSILVRRGNVYMRYSDPSASTQAKFGQALFVGVAPSSGDTLVFESPVAWISPCVIENPKTGAMWFAAHDKLDLNSDGNIRRQTFLSADNSLRWPEVKRMAASSTGRVAIVTTRRIIGRNVDDVELHVFDETGHREWTALIGHSEPQAIWFHGDTTRVVTGDTIQVWDSRGQLAHEEWITSELFDPKRLSTIFAGGGDDLYVVTAGILYKLVQ